MVKINEIIRGKGIDLWVIKKVIGLYQISAYRLHGGQVILDKDLFDEAIRKYYRGKLNSLKQLLILN